MRRIFISCLLSVTTLAFLAPDLCAQGPGGGRRSGGWDPGGAYGRLYDPGTVATLKGEVVRVERLSPIKGMSQGIHLTLRADGEIVPVHLGPAWFLDNQDLEIQPKDTITVKGSRITFEGKPAMIAAEVTKGDQVLILRDTAGIPMWAAWRRR